VLITGSIKIYLLFFSSSHNLQYFVKTYDDEKIASINPRIPSRKPAFNKYILIKIPIGRKIKSEILNFLPLADNSSAASEV